MELWSLVISVIALLFSGFTFLFYDRKLKRQDARINEYQLRQLEVAEQNRKKAQIKGNIIKGQKGARIMKIYNSGFAPAHNIRIEGIDTDGIAIINKELFPYELMNPQDYTELNLFIIGRYNQKLKVKYIWDDESGNDNMLEQMLTL